jgi:glutamate-ammonia-ligase adenylyltransferase
VINEESKQSIQMLCSDVGTDIIQDFFVRMDDDYFTTFSPEEIATHIRMSSGLGAKLRVQVRVSPRPARSPGAGTFDIIIVGFDYLSEFSVFCGMLSAFGLDIRAGNIYSFSKRAGRPSPRKIVDVFSVSINRGEVFDAAEQRDLELELQSFANLLAAGAIAEARERLNRFLTERIERMNAPLAGLLSPLDIQFENRLSTDWSVMEVRSEDTFAFLYAISNALAMHGIDIHKVKIRNIDGEARDQFFIADRWGRKIEDPQEQEKLRRAVAMMKQFTRFLPEAPDPGKAVRHFDQFLDKVADEGFPQEVISFLAGEEGMTRLAHLLGSSDFLWDDFLSTHFRDLLPVLTNFTVFNKESMRQELHTRLEHASSFEEKKRILNQFKDSEVFRIDVQHLLGAAVTVTDFSHSLTDLAEVIVDEAARICYERLGGHNGAFAICGLGKFGGREMGYASDLEMIFVHEEPGKTSLFESLARQTIEFIEARAKGFFHIDLRLRPYGDAGAWSIPFDEFRNYYSANGQAAPFERQALIKLRWIAGDERLGRRTEAHRDSFTFSGVAWDRENALHLRRRQMHELVKPGQVNVKHSAGGIVDIEYSVQYLQLLHGKNHGELRVPGTLEALDQLRRLQIVGDRDYGLLKSAYLFLRNLIDALRIVRGDASDLVLPAETSEEFKSLARRLGYRERDRSKGAALLAGDIRQTMTKVHEYFVEKGTGH